MKEIKLGTVGSGVIVHTILDQVQRTDGISPEAVCSRKAETGRALAASYGCRKVYPSLDALLQDDDVNTVYIATPNLLHVPQAKQALLAGKHVILEKPFSTNDADAKALAALAKQRHLLLAEAVPTPHLPNLRLLQDLLPQIGKVQRVVSDYSQYSARYDRLLQGELPNIFNPQLGGGCLMDLNFYNAYLNVFLFGMPDAVSYDPVLYPGAADTSGVLRLQYGDFLSENAAAKDRSGQSFFRIEGADGIIEIDNGANGLQSLRLLGNGKTQTFNAQGQENRWLFEVRALTRLFLAEDFDTVYALLTPTLQTCAVLERARKDAGLVFPGDD